MQNENAIDVATIKRWLHFNSITAAEAVRALELSGHSTDEAVTIVGDAILEEGGSND